MNDVRQGILEGLSVAIFLASKYQKQPRKILPALVAATERVQLVIGENTLDLFNVQTQRRIPPEKL
jgi:hypothetical protein